MIAVALTKREALLIERALKMFEPTEPTDAEDANGVLQMLTPPNVLAVNHDRFEGADSCGS